MPGWVIAMIAIVAMVVLKRAAGYASGIQDKFRAAGADDRMVDVLAWLDRATSFGHRQRPSNPSG